MEKLQQNFQGNIPNPGVDPEMPQTQPEIILNHLQLQRVIHYSQMLRYKPEHKKQTSKQTNQWSVVMLLLDTQIHLDFFEFFALWLSKPFARQLRMPFTPKIKEVL